MSFLQTNDNLEMTKTINSNNDKNQKKIEDLI